jgi:hypothetical protein
MPAAGVESGAGIVEIGYPAGRTSMVPRFAS